MRDQPMTGPTARTPGAPVPARPGRPGSAMVVAGAPYSAIGAAVSRWAGSSVTVWPLRAMS